MNELELFPLGRRLMKLGEDAISPSGFHQLTPHALALAGPEPGGVASAWR
jgi:hypothetical protein